MTLVLYLAITLENRYFKGRNVFETVFTVRFTSCGLDVQNKKEIKKNVEIWNYFGKNT